jgi:hypothetical protein
MVHDKKRSWYRPLKEGTPVNYGGEVYKVLCASKIIEKREFDDCASDTLRKYIFLMLHEGNIPRRLSKKNVTYVLKNEKTGEILSDGKFAKQVPAREVIPMETNPKRYQVDV